MDIIYQPNLGLSINDVIITWGMHRDQVRELLKVSYQEDNTTLDVGDLFDDDDGFDFSQNRDIYSSLTINGDSIFLSYEKNNSLTEFEMHEGIGVLIHDFRFYQDQPMTEIVAWFKQNNLTVVQLEPGNFAVAELKISVASHDAMGGHGDTLSYFYASNDVSHIID